MYFRGDNQYLTRRKASFFCIPEILRRIARHVGLREISLYGRSLVGCSIRETIKHVSRKSISVAGRVLS